jgi:uncharacterized membrane protein YozB (DUF420 family)
MDTAHEKPGVGPDRHLFITAAAIAALLLVLGFSRTYYLKTAFGSPPLSVLLHVHGLVMTLWFTLLIVQIRLAAKHRLDLHRRLGWIAAGLAVLLVVLGSAVAISAARQGHSPGPPPLVFLMLPLSIMVIFAVFTGLAIHYRRRPDIHKRLMLLGSLNMLSPAIARIPILHSGGPAVFIGLTVLLVLACVAVDTIQNRRLHPAFGWGAGLLILSFPLRMFLGNTETWQRFAAWLVASP